MNPKIIKAILETGLHLNQGLPKFLEKYKKNQFTYFLDGNILLKNTRILRPDHFFYQETIEA